MIFDNEYYVPKYAAGCQVVVQTAVQTRDPGLAADLHKSIAITACDNAAYPSKAVHDLS